MFVLSKGVLSRVLGGGHPPWNGGVVITIARMVEDLSSILERIL